MRLFFGRQRLLCPQHSPLSTQHSVTPLLLSAAAAALALAAGLPSPGRDPDQGTFELAAPALTAGSAVGVHLDSLDGALTLARGAAENPLVVSLSNHGSLDKLRTSGQRPGLFGRTPREAPSSIANPTYPRFGVAESAPQVLPAPSAISAVSLDADVPPGGAISLDIRGYVRGRWTEWHGVDALEDLDGAAEIQTRAWLFSGWDGTSPRVRAVRGRASRAGVNAAQAPRGPPTVKLWATRIGLVGRTTANGHLIAERDRFVSLPSTRSLNRRDGTDYLVQVSYRGRTAVAPVWDVGPWNTKDDYWNEAREQFRELPRWVPQAEAAFFFGHNGGHDGFGRFVTMPASIDLADGTFWDELGMTASDWVDVTFLWVDALSPPPRPTPSVTSKTPPVAPIQTPQPMRAASYNAPAPSAHVFLPLVVHDPSGWTTSWTVQNPWAEPAHGLVALYNASGGRAGQQSFSLPPFGSTTFSPPELPGVPSGFAGAAVVEASGPVAAVVHIDRPGGDRLAYEGIGDGAPWVAVPLVLKEYNGWSTGIHVQNVGTRPSTVQLIYVDASGSAWAETGAIAPMASRSFSQSANALLPGGFVGSAIVQSMDGQPIAVVASGGHASGAAMASPGIAGATERLHAPLLLKKYNGWSTGLQLLNLSRAPASVVVSYQGTPPLPAGYAEGATIPGGSSMTLYQGTHPRLSDGFIGWASLVGAPGAQLVGLVNEVKEGKQVAMNYLLGKPPLAVVALPLVMKAWDGWETGIQVLNAGLLPAQMELTFYDEGGLTVHRIEEPIEPGGARAYYPPSIAEVPSGFRGSAVIRETFARSGLAVIVNETTR